MGRTDLGWLFGAAVCRRAFLSLGSGTNGGFGGDSRLDPLPIFWRKVRIDKVIDPLVSCTIVEAATYLWGLVLEQEQANTLTQRTPRFRKGRRGSATANTEILASPE